MTKNTVFLKLESQQPHIFSFKGRGAYNRIATLSDEEKKRGVITASAGNHAQGVALATQKLNIPAIIVMPKSTPHVKVDAVRRLNPNAKIILEGNDFSQALVHARKLEEKKDLTFIHPFDDDHVIAGQGTIAKEIFEQHEASTIGAIFVPVGGGGLLAGIAAWVKYHHPHILVIGVEPAGSNCLQQALIKGEPLTLPYVDRFPEGVAVSRIGEKTFQLTEGLVDGVITVTHAQICQQVATITNDTHTIVEPSGAVAAAGAARYLKKHTISGDAVVIVSGGNVSTERTIYSLDLASRASGKELLLRVEIPEKAGALKQLCRHLNHHNITEFNYLQKDGSKKANIFIGLRVRKIQKEWKELQKELTKANYTTEKLTQNNLAHEHIRHMIGGSACHPKEKIYSFSLPETPEALNAFLNHLPEECNITLCHYRNNGGTQGSVLMGFSGPDHILQKMHRTLKSKGYKLKDESKNTAYQNFLTPHPT